MCPKISPKVFVIVAFIASIASLALAQGTPDIQWMRGGNPGDHYAAAYLDSERFLTLSRQTLKIFRVSDGILLKTVPVQGYYFDITKDRSSVAVWGSGPGLKVFRTGDLSPLQSINISGTVIGDRGARFSPDGQYIAASANQNAVQLWSVATGEMIRTYAINGSPSFSPNGQLIAGTTSLSGQPIKVLTVSDGTLVKDYSSWSSGPHHWVEFTPDGQHLLSTPFGSPYLGVWRISDACAFTCAPVVNLGSHIAREVDFSPNGSVLAINEVINNQAHSTLWTTAGWAQGQAGFIRSYVSDVGGNHTAAQAFSSDGTALLSSGYDMTVWSVADGSLLHDYDAIGTYLNAAAYSPNGEMIATGGWIGDGTFRDGGIKLWNATDGSLIRTIDFGADAVNYIESLSYSHNNQILAATGAVLGAAGNADPKLRLFDVNTGSLIRSINSPVRCSAVFSPDDEMIAAASGGTNIAITLLNASDGSVIRTIPGSYSCSLSFSPDGTRITNGQNVYRVSDGALLFNIGNRLSSISKTASYSLDGRFIATSDSGGIQIVDATNGALLRSLTGHSNPGTLAFAPDSRTLISEGVDSTIRLWDVETGAQLRMYDKEIGNPGLTNSAVRLGGFAPDGSSFAYIRVGDGTLIKAANPLYVAPDSTPPVITPNVTPPMVSDYWGVFYNGWYRWGNVQVSWTVTDPESEVTATEGCDTTEISELSGDTAGITVTCTATSAGGTDSHSVIIRRDSTSPETLCPPSDGLWHAANLSFNCTMVDSISGLSNPSQANVTASTYVGPGEQDAWAYARNESLYVCNNAGYCSEPYSGPYKIDRKAPIITVQSPALGPYLVNQVVPIVFACSDGEDIFPYGSGVATCAGSVPSGSDLDTASVGQKTFSVNSTDNVGNAATANLNYAVRYGILPLYNFSKPLNGKNLQIKLALVDANNVNVSGLSASLRALDLVPVAGGDSTAVNADFRYDSKLKGYVLNLSTAGISKGTYTLRFVATADPDMIYDVQFQFGR